MAPLAAPPIQSSKSGPQHEGLIPQDIAPLTAKRRWRRWSLWFLMLVIAVVGGFWMARGPIMARVESVVVQRLAERGVYLHYSRRSWSLGQGLRLEEVVLHREAKGEHRLIEVSALAVAISIPELFKTRSLISRWSTNDATVTLHDEEGPMTFEHVTTKIVVRARQIETSRLDFQRGPRTFALSGKILLAQNADEPPAPAPLLIDLSTVREVLSVLDFKEGHAPFALQGSYSLDLRAGAAVWQADLTGTGRDLEWQGVPLHNATVQGRLSSAGMNLTSRLQFTTGSADVSLTRRDWKDGPLLIAGSLTDGANQTDEFSATYENASRKLNVSSLRGKAHLLEFAGNFPMLVPHLPTVVQFQKFPDLVVTDFSYSFAKQPAAWSVASIQTHSPGEVTLLVGGEPLKIGALDGVVAFANNTWKAQLKTGPLSWMMLAVKGADIDGTLAASRLQAKGRKIGVLLTNGFDAALLTALRRSAKAEKAALFVIAPKVGGVDDADGVHIEADGALSASASVFYDAVVILASAAGAKDLATQAGAIDWTANAFAHLKVIGHTATAQPLLDAANVKPDAGVVPLTNAKSVGAFIKAARNGRMWNREPSLRRPG